MNLEENMYNHENNLSKFASLSKNAIRLKQEESDIRPAYFRDIDRIIYSLSYTRYIDKTQVFSLKENDHISKRIIHVQFVSKIAKTIVNKNFFTLFILLSPCMCISVCSPYSRILHIDQFIF